ncbi:MAG: hypothetical protein K2O33_03340, partial [Muribaculaceae bacterium]|nr:hypothetical protein [Muribaculaceae bacterium]
IGAGAGAAVFERSEYRRPPAPRLGPRLIDFRRALGLLVLLGLAKRTEEDCPKERKRIVKKNRIGFL